MTAINTTYQAPLNIVKLIAAIYIRVSSEQQEKGLSLETQLEQCIAYCHEHGYIVDEQYIYREVMTGVVYRERPRLTELRAAAKKHLFQIVVVFELDRFARDPIHQAIVKDELEYYDVKLECVKRQIDDSPEGQLVQYAQGFVARMEYEKIKERTQRGRRARVEKGALYGTKDAKFGYIWGDEKKKTYAYNTENKLDKSGNEWTEADIVTRIFDSLDEGVALRTLASQFTQEGIPTRSGKPYWRAEAITRIAHDEDYTGDAAVYKTRTTKLPNGSKQVERRPREEWVKLPEGTVPALVDKAKFARVQERLKDNGKFSQRNNRHPQDSLLRYGIAVCGHCGNVMRAKWIASKKWQSATYYQCNAETGRLGGCEHRPTLKAETLDNAVWEFVRAKIEDPQQVERHLEAQLKQDDPTAEDRTSIERSLKKVLEEQENLLASLPKLNPKYAGSIYNRLNELADMQTEAEKDLEKLKSTQKSWEEIQEELKEFKEWCADFRANVDRDNASYEEKLRAIKRFNVVVYVYRRDPITQKPNYEITAKPVIVLHTVYIHQMARRHQRRYSSSPTRFQPSII
jgi:site-specific DNA recombinase